MQALQTLNFCPCSLRNGKWTPYPRGALTKRLRVPKKTGLCIQKRGLFGPREQQAPPLSDVSVSAVDLVSIGDVGGGGFPLSVGVLAAAVLSIGGFFAWRLYLYSQIEYVTASMLSRQVPSGGARVIQVGGGTKELYYYPKGTVQVTVVGKDISPGLFEQAGVQAQIPVVVREQSPEQGSLGAGSVADAFVVLGKLGSMKHLTGFLEEACRVLKPGGRFIFIEKVEADGFSGTLQGLVGDKAVPIKSSVLDTIKNFRGFSEVTWDIASEGQNPYVVGLGITAEVEMEVRVKSTKSKKKRKKGFAS